VPDQDQRLEQRVKALEYELKILKNEIQKVLLGIQEQILVHYYPTLRTEESAPGGEVKQAFERLQQNRGALAEAAMPARAKSAAEPSSAGAPPATRAVSLAELRKGSGSSPAATQYAESSTPGEEEQALQGEANPVTPEQQAVAMALSSWVSSTAEKIGGGRTTKLIETCSQRRFFGAQYDDLLRRLSVFTSGTAGPEKVAVNDYLSALLKLDEALGRQADMERALSLIEEMKVG
jgi:hypothetical protein